MTMYNATIKNDGRVMNRAFPECSPVTKLTVQFFYTCIKKEKNYMYNTCTHKSLEDIAKY